MSSSFGIPPIGQAPSSDALSLPEPHSTHNKGVKRAHPPELESPGPAGKFRKLDNDDDATQLPAAALASAAAAPVLSANNDSPSPSPLSDDDDCKEENPTSRPFPFPVTALPSFEDHQGEWFQKTGLTSAEFSPIESWVTEKMGEWESLQKSEVLRFTKESTGLARTIHVFRAHGRICVQVLCKTKKRIKKVGEGGFKKGKRSVEWITKTLWLQYTSLHPNTHQDILKGISIHDQVAGEVGIYPQLVGRSSYTSEKGGFEKLSFFGPLREGDCAKIYKHVEQRYSIAWQLLKALCALEKANIIHQDLDTSNILFYLGKNQEVYVEINDFDIAQISNLDLAQSRENRNPSEEAFLGCDLTCISDIFGILKIDPEFRLSMPQRSARQCLAAFETQFAEQLSQTGS